MDMQHLKNDPGRSLSDLLQTRPYRAETPLEVNQRCVAESVVVNMGSGTQLHQRQMVYLHGFAQARTRKPILAVIAEGYAAKQETWFARLTKFSLVRTIVVSNFKAKGSRRGWSGTTKTLRSQKYA